MYFRYSIIALIALCSLLSVLGADYAMHKKYLFWKVSFYGNVYLFIPLIVKCFLGHQKETLIGSFWSMSTATLIHYGVPMCIMAIAMPIVLKWVFKKSGGGIIGVIQYFDSSLFFTLSLAFLLVRKMNNGIYCIAFVLASAMTFAAILLKKTEMEYICRAGIKNKVLAAAPVLLYYMVTVVIYTPSELYLNNFSDFPMSYWYFFGKLLAAGILATAVLMAGVVLYLNQGHMNLYTALLFALLTAGYIQGMFLNGNMGVLDGTDKNAYNKLEIYINMGIWIAIAIAVIIFAIKKSGIAQKFMKVISIWITLIQIVSLGVMVITSKGTEAKNEMVLTTEGMTDVGQKNNVIVFILDKFDSRWVDEITEQYPDFFEPLKDFVFYRNATSEFNRTYHSIPFLLSGTEWEEGTNTDYLQYVQYAYKQGSLLEDISDAGYDIGIYTDKSFVSESMSGMVSNCKDGVKMTCRMKDLFSLMTQCSRYKMSPLAAKQYYIYDTRDIALLSATDNIANIENDLPFYYRLRDNGLRIADSNAKGTFRFIHMLGAHPPYTMTEDFQYIPYDAKRDNYWSVSGISQSKGAMKIVYEYMRQLKELGKYDDSLIVITADHGFKMELLDPHGNMTDVSYPILFVKQPYEKHEKMAISAAPVCHLDVIATLRKQMGIYTSDRTLDEIGSDEKRVRYTINSKPERFEKYEINGDVSLVESWRLISISGKESKSTH